MRGYEGCNCNGNASQGRLHVAVSYSSIKVGGRVTGCDLCCRLLDVVGENTALQDAFLLADDVLRQVCSNTEPSLKESPQMIQRRPWTGGHIPACAHCTLLEDRSAQLNAKSFAFEG